ncbi:MAG: aminoglycoside phosphotransferase family protein [Frankiaceae bacterium]
MNSGARTEMLAGRAGVDGVRGLLYGRSTRTRLRPGLASLLTEGATLARLRLERAKLKPGRKLTGYYLVDVRLLDGVPVSRAVEVTWSADGAPDQVQPAETAMEEEARIRGVAVPFEALRWEAPDLGARVRIAPLDVAYPQLVRLCDPEHVRVLLAAAYGEAGHDEVVAPTYDVTAVRYRPRQRHVLRYDPVGTRGAGPVFAKVYTAGSAAPALRIATAIADRVEGQPVPVAAARPLGGSAADDVVLFSRLAGVPLTRRLWTDSAATGRHLRTAGALLRRLQADPGALRSDLSTRDFPRETRAVARAAEHLAPLDTSLGSQVERLLDGALALNATIAAEEPCFAHGDYKSDHLWIARDRLTLLDFDTCCLAEPALDVGKFLADLSWWHMIGGRSDVAEAQQCFLAGYGAMSRERLARARLYEVLILTKIIIRRLRRFELDWAPRTAGCLEQAEHLLAVAAGHDKSPRGAFAR